MTMFNPNLKINNISVFSRSKNVLDVSFHSGLNIIRGENSSGKSTIMDFLFYGLGGDLQAHQWRETSLKCDEVFLEVEINGNPLTLKREVDDKQSRGMSIYFGPKEEALSQNISGWEKYSYARRGDKESFSQVLFRIMGLPEIQYDETKTKLTIHQILRLIYSDQLTPVDKIFRNQSFDDAITRQSVGDLLLGGFSRDFYRAKILLKEAEEQIKKVQFQRDALNASYSIDGHPLTESWLQEEIKSHNISLKNLNLEIQEIENKIFDAQFSDRLTLNDQKKTRSDLTNLQEEISSHQSKIELIDYEIADSIEYISELNKKIKDINEAKSIIDHLPNISFDYCPACFSKVDHDNIEHACSLCHSPYDSKKTRERATHLLNSYQRQINQSIAIQENRLEKKNIIEQELANLNQLWQQASERYTVSLRSPTTELRSQLRDLNRQAGYIYRQLEELAQKKSLIEKISQLNDEYDRLNKRISNLKEIINLAKNRTVEQISKARIRIERCALDFLHNDLERQATFSTADKVDFQFDSDRMSVNDETFFSASSMVYLRNSFLASLLFAASSDSSFNHPRLLLMDTIEDKGMEQERSQHFQRLLADKSNTALSKHQIIIATSMIAPDLDIDKYTVGEKYTHTNRSLAF